jgi:hypothetical protein
MKFDVTSRKGKPEPASVWHFIEYVVTFFSHCPATWPGELLIS